MSDKRGWLGLLLVLSLCWGAVPAGAAGWSPTTLRQDWAPFLLGLAGGIAAHELGHVVVAKARGYHLDHEGLSITYPEADFSRSGQLQTASAGLQVQWLVTEAVFAHQQLRNPDQPPGPLAAGLVSAHLAISAAYLTVLKNHAQGDVVGMAEATDLSTDQLVLLALVPALLDGWRLFGDQVPPWVPALSIGFKGAALTAIWTY